MVRICISLIFFITNGLICMGFIADNLKKGRKNTYLNGFLEEKNHLKVIEDQLVFLPFARQ